MILNLYNILIPQGNNLSAKFGQHPSSWCQTMELKMSSLANKLIWKGLTIDSDWRSSKKELYCYFHIHQPHNLTYHQNPKATSSNVWNLQILRLFKADSIQNSSYSSYKISISITLSLSSSISPTCPPRLLLSRRFLLAKVTFLQFFFLLFYLPPGLLLYFSLFDWSRGRLGTWTTIGDWRGGSQSSSTYGNQS